MNLVGDKRTLAFEFLLTEDPDSQSPPEVAASWGRMRVWVAGRNLTSGLSVAGQALDTVECPLLPIVRWFIDSWDPIFHEERLPRPKWSTSAGWHTRALASASADDATLDRLLDDRTTWWNHHGMGAALPGFRIPDVHFRRLGEDVEISWNDREWRGVPGGVDATVEPGVVTLPIDGVCTVVQKWCRAVLDVVSHTCDVQVEFGALSDLTSPTRTRSRLMLTAGLKNLKAVASRIRQAAGVFDGPLDATVDQLLGIAGQPSGQLFAKFTVPVMLFRSANPALSEQDLSCLFSMLSEFGVGDTSSFVERRTPCDCPLEPEEATQDGYERAVALRDALGIPENMPLSHQYDLEGVVLKGLGIAVQDITLDDRGVEGVALWSPERMPVIAVNSTGHFSSRRWGRRMTLAHELCHLMHDGSQEVGLGLASNPWAPRMLERRANAFAAMFIAPPAALELLLGPQPQSWDSSILSKAMAELGVGATMLCRHLQNLGMATTEQSDAWMNDLVSRR